MFRSYYVGRTATTDSTMCLGCEITSQRMFSEHSMVLCHKRCGHFPECRGQRSSFPTERMFSQSTAPDTENGNLLSKERLLVFLGNIKGPLSALQLPTKSDLSLQF